MKPVIFAHDCDGNDCLILDIEQYVEIMDGVVPYMLFQETPEFKEHDELIMVAAEMPDVEPMIIEVVSKRLVYIYEVQVCILTFKPVEEQKCLSH